MKHTIRHGLSHELARRATQRALESYKEQFAEYQPRGTWRDDRTADVSFTVLARELRGKVVVGPVDVELELEVPLLFRAFRSTAMQIIEKEIQSWIELARRGELDG